MEPVVVSLGGSVLIREEGDTAYLRKLAKILIGLSSSHKLFVVTGGGRIARYYIAAGRDLGADENFLDELGIEVTRLNARLLITALGDRACHVPPRNYDEALQAGRTHSIVVMGGVSPGITTDAVAALLAERVKAKRLVNATSVDGAYSADPKKDPGATRISKMTHKELIALVGSTPAGAGPSVVFDPVGAKVLERSKISLAIVEGRDLANLRDAIEGRAFKGTTVV
ncbi:MAG: UMP kinase [Thermoplasmata archaeon]